MRVNAASVSYEEMSVQYGDPEVAPFSFDTKTPPENRAVCYLTHTTGETHEIIRPIFTAPHFFPESLRGWPTVLPFD